MEPQNFEEWWVNQNDNWFLRLNYMLNHPNMMFVKEGARAAWDAAIRAKELKDEHEKIVNRVTLESQQFNAGFGCD